MSAIEKPDIIYMFSFISDLVNIYEVEHMLS